MSASDEPEIDEGQPLEVLDPDVCVELLTHGSFVGRIGLVVEGRPLVLPVNYTIDRETIVSCTAAGTKLSAVIDEADVAFEVDDSRLWFTRAGAWSCVVAPGSSRMKRTSRICERGRCAFGRGVLAQIGFASRSTRSRVLRIPPI